MNNANEQRILVTGYLPKPPAGEVFDVVDVLGRAYALPDATWHMNSPLNRDRLEELNQMPSYVAGVALRDVERSDDLLQATRLVVFDKPYNFNVGLRMRRANRLREIQEKARQLGIPSVFLHNYADALEYADVVQHERRIAK